MLTKNEKEYNRKYREKNRDKRNAYNREYSKSHREQLRIKLNEWRRKNSDRRREKAKQKLIQELNLSLTKECEPDIRFDIVEYISELKRRGLTPDKINEIVDYITQRINKHQETFNLTKLNIIRGYISEYCATRYYESLGYYVFKTSLWKALISQYKFDKLSIDTKTLNYISTIQNRLHKGYSKSHSEKGMPDLICLKGEEVFFVECKSSTLLLTIAQKRAIKRLINKKQQVKLFSCDIVFSDNKMKIINTEIYTFSLK